MGNTLMHAPHTMRFLSPQGVVRLLKKEHKLI